MSEITDAFVKDATTEYLSHRGEQPYEVLRSGAQLWETHAPAIRAALTAANRLSRALAPQASEPDWQDDPSADERWNAGLDFGQQQLCKCLGVDPDDVTWDAATEELEGDVQAVIGNIMRTKFGDDWSPSDGAIYAAVSRASVTDAEHGDMMRAVDAKLGDLAAPPVHSAATAAEPAAVPYEKHEAEMLKIIDEREAAQGCIDGIYFNILGRAPEWSNMFGFKEAVDEITDTVASFIAGKVPDAAPTTSPEPDAVSDPILVQRCKELLEWGKTGLLNGGCGGEARKLADELERKIGNHYALSVAESQVRDDAMREVVRLAALSAPVAGAWQESMRRIRDFPHNDTVCEQAMSQIAREALTPPRKERSTHD